MSAQAQSHFTRYDSEYRTTHHEDHFGLAIANEAHRVKKKQTAPRLVLTISFSPNSHIHLTLLLPHTLSNSPSPYRSLIRTFP